MNDPHNTIAHDTTAAPDRVSTVVRGQAVWTGVYALAALYFGWYSIPPSEMLGIQIIRFTLQYGGAGMLLAALVLLSGSAGALIVDAAASMLAGVGLAIGALLLLQYNVAYGVVCLIFGYLFFSSGRRSVRDYRQFNAPADVDADETTESLEPPVEPAAKSPAE